MDCVPGALEAMRDSESAAGSAKSAADPPQAAMVLGVCHKHGDAPGALIEILHDVHSALGCVPDGLLPVIAGALNLSRAEVYGVRTFYHDFRSEPAGKHILKLCRAEACQAMGSDRLADSVTQTLGIEIGGTTGNGEVTVEAVYCLGNCALGPAAMLDGKLIGRCSERTLAPVLAAGTAGRR
jgi:formate dehydrogenase subunit gamma